MMQGKHMWAGVSIAVIWIAVGFVGVFGPTLEVATPHRISIPVLAMVVSGCALVGTIFVAIFGFRK
jgi:hypothetical protein